ncbi:ABC transporter permease protein [Roseomonas mucosa]|jgi:D-methionine transport system permease protein|uniref:D-methionine transport system permease protein metI n=1 Tax=Roseomonas mucosa TaxID=207340 RepID=A0A1S8D402_9PROT|nr:MULTISPECIES: methionine ABC transporter permease [Roseomonas]MBS5903362.1 ABC transporter permease [Acetobacteraceae bacterium]MDT8263088.1 methionine ABC transporter permease [Roseomonas sp. DSM 102946]AWV20999.1 ABC transporter permease protein [Roseomonas mucosa]MCG7351785.1 ABC transporter permease [Roseomonas mucosa]MCG7357071.1 ABC transporter permease [Roseomonas mucosa]
MPNLFPWLPPALQDLMIDAAWETITMVFVSVLVAVAIGLPLALLLYSTGQGGLRPNGWINRPLGLLINAVRSTPFIILMVAIVPFTRLVAGTSIGTAAAIVPLALASTAFISRLFEGALREVDRGVIEAARAMGATRMQILTRVLVPEAMPGIIAAVTVTLVSLVGYSAMAGAIGGGGLGDLGIRFGYQRFMPEVMATVVVILILFVQGLQSLGDWLVRRVSHR